MAKRRQKDPPLRARGWPGFPCIWVALVQAEFQALSMKAIRKTRPSR